MAPLSFKTVVVTVLVTAYATFSAAETSADMTCADFGGISYEDSAICCASECGECGGKGCRDRPGGRYGCCIQKITEADVLCTESGLAPCMLMHTPAPTPAASLVEETIAPSAASRDMVFTSAPTAAEMESTSAPSVAEMESTSAPTMTAEETAAPTMSVMHTAGPTMMETMMATDAPTTAPTEFAFTMAPSSDMDTAYPTAGDRGIFFDSIAPTSAPTSGFDDRDISFSSSPTAAPTGAPTVASSSADTIGETEAPTSGASSIAHTSGVVTALAAGLVIAGSMLI